MAGKTEIKNKKAAVVKKFSRTATDTGSPANWIRRAYNTLVAKQEEAEERKKQ
jgi:hypothetical protein